MTNCVFHLLFIQMSDFKSVYKTVFLLWIFCQTESICLTVWLPVCLSVCQSVSLSIWLSVCLSVSQLVSQSSVSQSVCLFDCLSACLSVCLPICLTVCLSVWLSVCQSVCLFICFPFTLSSSYLPGCMSFGCSCFFLRPVSMSDCLENLSHVNLP